jgi:predicted HD phosphohydrolase
MDANEQEVFATNQHFVDAIKLRRADDAAKIKGLSVPGLDVWRPILQALAHAA